MVSEAASLFPPSGSKVDSMARWLITAGILILLTGVVLALFPRAFSWFGNLPGDINVRRGNSRLIVPLTSMILVSLGLTVVINLLAWLVRQLR